MSFHHLQKTKTSYYFRVAVPQDLRHLFPVIEIRRSLKTKDKKSAKLLATKWAGSVDSLFTKIRSGIFTEQQIQEMIQKDISLRSPVPHIPFAPAHPTPPAPRLPKPKMLEKVIEDFLRENMLMGKWTEKTGIEITNSLKMFREVLGNVPIREIDRKRMVDYTEQLSRLPANMHKKVAYRDKTVHQMLKMKVPDPMSTASVNKYLSRANSLLIWTMRQGFIDRNPADGLNIADKTIREDEERNAFSLDDIKRIRATLPPYPSDEPERYFVPLIGMYSGARINEICQLYMEDIREVEGVMCFDINDEKDKRLKTISSRRIIPVHPRLVEIGFLEYVQQLRNSGSERLWPNLKRKRDGYSQSVGRWFQYHNRKHITTDPKKCFHSFRHTVADTLKQAGVAEGIISEILGHANGSITTGRYGKRYRPGVLLEALVKLNY